MSAVAAAVLEPVGQARVALQGVAVEARLQGLLSEVTVAQTYRNLEDTNIEATYTFPLPLDAVLLELTLELNGRQLRGVVQAKAAAEERYEGAIDDGDTAVLLQQIEPGTFSMNLGNLLAGETAVVRFRYAQLHRWQGDRLRFHLPTTIAPRYGDPLAAGYAPHQVPEHALTADHGFTLKLEIAGQLAQADFDCPSHPVAVSHYSDSRVLTLAGGSRLMDRDFVLVLRAPATWGGEGTFAADGDGYVALASFHLPVPDRRDHAARCLKLVVDCSGSMAGDSIAQARAALHEILGHLRPGDHFNLMTFGSTHRLLFPVAVPATDVNVRVAADFLRGLDANMGGTETGAALDAAYACRAPAGLPTDLLLITDGEITDHRRVVERARRSGHRIFTVGVGSAVAEAFVRPLAEATGGACELVSPREGMAERIVRHFARIDQPRVRSVRVDWPQRPTRQIPGKFDALFAGDTLHVFGWFAAAPVGGTTLHVQAADGEAVAQSAALAGAAAGGSQDVLRRIAAHARLAELPSAQATELAVEYQLVTEHTSCVLVHVRETGEKAEGVPVLRKVPQVLAAGWGGTGIHACAAPPRQRSFQDAYRGFEVAECASFDLGDEFAFLRRKPTAGEDAALAAGLNARYPDAVAAELDITQVAELVELGLEPELGEWLLGLVDSGASERQVVITFLMGLLIGPTGSALSRHVQRLIRRAGRDGKLDRRLQEVIWTRLMGLTV
jgi:Ca-activated chloride channel family protein